MNWIRARLAEPSTYGAFGGLCIAGGFYHHHLLVALAVVRLCCRGSLHRCSRARYGRALA
jgi:hypothetical protein